MNFFNKVFELIEKLIRYYDPINFECSSSDDDIEGSPKHIMNMDNHIIYILETMT